jgi:hypothetical protein
VGPVKWQKVCLTGPGNDPWIASNHVHFWESWKEFGRQHAGSFAQTHLDEEDSIVQWYTKGLAVPIGGYAQQGVPQPSCGSLVNSSYCMLCVANARRGVESNMPRSHSMLQEVEIGIITNFQKVLTVYIQYLRLSPFILEILRLTEEVAIPVGWCFHE